jgi:hypothetical protein
VHFTNNRFDRVSAAGAGAVLDHKYKGDFPDIVGVFYRFHHFSKSAYTHPRHPRVNRGVAGQSLTLKAIRLPRDL